MKTALSAAQYIYDKGFTNNIVINKLLYISFGFYGASHDEYLFGDKIEAWQYGPVIPNVYSEFKKNGFYFGHNRNELTNEEKETINDVLSLYGDKAPFLLVELTHKKGTPWSDVYVDGEKNIEIKKESIINYYKNFIQISDKLVKQIADEDFERVMKELSKT